MKIVVIGGSGVIGKKLIPILRGRGHEAVSASLSSGVNTNCGAPGGAGAGPSEASRPKWESIFPDLFFKEFAVAVTQIRDKRPTIQGMDR